MEMEYLALLHIIVSFWVVLLILYLCNKLSHKLRPYHTDVDKLKTYESGAEPLGNARASLKSNLYVLGLTFLLFELETILLLPWALVYTNRAVGDPRLHSHLALVGTIFILILGVGWVYVMRNWKSIMGQDPPNLLTDMADSIPAKYYERINDQYAPKLDALYPFTTRHE